MSLCWARATFHALPVLCAEMTSELGCVTPWIIVPDQHRSQCQLCYYTRHLFASLYSNASASCNSSKVLILPRDWPYAREFISLLIVHMTKHPLPVSCSPGTRHRWMAFRNAYNDGDLTQEYGDSKIRPLPAILRPSGRLAPPTRQRGTQYLGHIFGHTPPLLLRPSCFRSSTCARLWICQWRASVCIALSPRMTPKLISGWSKRARSPATIKSHILANSHYPPKQKPFGEIGPECLRGWRV
jgi:hypothetical protein